MIQLKRPVVQRRITIDVTFPYMKDGTTVEDSEEINRWARQWNAVSLAFAIGLQALSDTLRDDPTITITSRIEIID